MSILRSHKTERIQRAEKALLEANFSERHARLLAILNWWIFPFTVFVTLMALIWVGLHLWPDLDVARWEAWAEKNVEFFAPLDSGATVAIIPELHSHAGLLIRKTGEGIDVERHFWFPFEEVPVGLVVAPEVADQVLELRFGDEDFWRQWATLAEDRGISLYQHLGQRSEHRAGYEAFLAQMRRSAGR
jgi:hypothetical protein